MKLKDCLDAYQDFSRQASDNVRKLGFAAIAIIWVFKTESPQGGVAMPPLLVWAGFLVVLSLIFDFLQYIYGTAAWGFFHRIKELAGSCDEDFLAPHWINWPTNALFILKTLAVGIGYVLLLVFFSRTLF